MVEVPRRAAENMNMIPPLPLTTSIMLYARKGKSQTSEFKVNPRVARQIAAANMTRGRQTLQLSISTASARVSFVRA